MANLLADPNNWRSYQSGTGDDQYVGPPSQYWDASTSSYNYYAEAFSIVKASMELVASPSGGDLVAGEFEALTVDPVGGQPASLSAYSQAGDLLWSINGQLGQRIAFSEAAQAGMQLATALPGLFLYAGESRVYVTTAPEPGQPDAALILPAQVRAHYGIPSLVRLWARGEVGPLDLSEQDLSVSVRMYGNTAELMSIPATGDSSGGVSFTVPNDLGKRYGRGLYRILVVSAANGATHEGTLEVL